MNAIDEAGENATTQRAVNVAIRVGAIGLLLFWCATILSPFVPPVLWGIILAVALRPFHRRLTDVLRGKNKTAAAAITLVGLVLLFVPSVFLVISIGNSAHALAEGIQDGTLEIPAPPEDVADWPFVGESVYDAWSLGATNLEGAVNRYGPQLEAVGVWLLSAGGNAVVQILLFALSIAIAGVMMAKAKANNEIAHAIGRRLGGERGYELVDLSTATIRSVAKGVLGVAFIQALLCGVGMLVMGIPGAGIWALLCMLVAIVQLPPLLVMAPIIIFAFAHYETTPAVLFTVWSVLSSSSDTLLKPLLLGRGVDVPMLVILLGAIGGMLTYGLIGLFVGAVVLALGYNLLLAWVRDAPARSPGTS